MPRAKNHCKNIPSTVYFRMAYEIEFADEFEFWWNALSQEEQISINASAILLEEYGVQLKYPHSSGINRSKHAHVRELRTQHEGRPYRTLYAFNPLRTAILLLAGDKTGDDDWYDKNVPVADRLYDQHLGELRKEGFIDD